MPAMSHRRPTVSLVTPSFNQRPYLEQAIRSVLEQDEPPIEYFVHDGGSSDGSSEIIERFADRLTGWYSRPDGGQSSAINEGWRKASGDLVGWLNSDDFLLPGALRTVADVFESRPETDLVYGQVQLVDGAGSGIGLIGEPFSRRTLILSRCVIPQPAAFLRRRLLADIGLLDEDLHYTMDLDLWLRVAERSRPLFLRAPLAGATVHPDAKTTRARSPMARERQRVRAGYARGPERIVVRLQPIASQAYHRAPEPVRELIERSRPKRLRADRPNG